MGDFSASFKHLRDARRYAPHNLNIAYHLAATLADAGATDEAREILEAILATGGAFRLRGEATTLLEQLG